MCGTYVWRGHSRVGPPTSRVEGAFTCGSYSHVEGTFTCGTYSHVEGTFTCGSYSRVRGDIQRVGPLLTCGGDIHV